MFSLPHSRIPAPERPYNWSILTVYVNDANRDLKFQRADGNENVNVERVKPSTGHFDILTFVTLTRETVSSRRRDSGWIDVFVKILTGSLILSSRRFSLARSLFCATTSALTKNQAQAKTRQWKSILKKGSLLSSTHIYFYCFFKYHDINRE